MTARLVLSTEAELMEYIYRERLRCKENKITGHSVALLETCDDTFVCVFAYRIFYEGVIVGFAITPSFGNGVLMRLYVEPEYRRLGIGRFVVNELKITTLSCFTSNTVGMKFYTALGFNWSPSFTTTLVNFKRENYELSNSQENPRVL